MRSSRTPNLIVGLVAAILAVNVVIFWLLIKKDKKKDSNRDSFALATPKATQAGSAFPPLQVEGDIGDAETQVDDAEELAADPGDVDPEENSAEENSAEENGAEENGAEENGAEENTAEVEPEDDDAQSEVTETAPVTRRRSSHTVPKRKRRSSSSRASEKNSERQVVPPVPVPMPKPAPATTSLDVTTVPSGATISLDGIFIGKTPIRGAKVAFGRHTVAASHAGFEPQVTKFNATQGERERVQLRLEKVELVDQQVAVKRTPTMPKVQRRPATPRVLASVEGSASRGRSAIRSTCNSCHAERGASSVSTKRYTRSQWDRFFAKGKHDRYERLGGRVNARQLSDVKAYVKSKSADAARNQGAGIR